MCIRDRGNSGVTFRATCIGLLINVVLDPVLIFGPGPLPALGVAGAAIATVLAQVIVFVVYLLIVRKDPVIFSRLHLLHRTEASCFREILGIGFPVAVQSLLFTGISMIIARLIAGWGDAAVAVQKAVSYTHLDVYKRQARRTGRSQCGRAGPFPQKPGIF